MNGTDGVRVLIVDDSATARRALRLALESDPGIEVVGEVARADDVLHQVRRLRPHIVTMDVHLDRQNGIDVAATLMREQAVPILVVTAANPSCPDLVYRAMAAGVLEVCAKLPAATCPEYVPRRQEIVRLVRALARVPVVHRRLSVRPSAPPSSGAVCADHRESAEHGPASSRITLDAVGEHQRAGRFLLIGASTGGPKILRDLLCAAPRRLSLPVVLAQHIAAGFAPGLAEWLASESRRTVRLVEVPTIPEPGVVYLPPAERHLEVRGGVLVPTDLPGALHTPSIDLLFSSAARYAAQGTVAVLLTGMGRDGASGLLALSHAGATTIAQQLSSCIVDSMPRAAIAEGAAQLVLTPNEIAEMLVARCSA
ncbi:MAG: response regulator [Polyangiaceae bacterium]|nr:response regulator [Polyangiaceae bacterium]